MNVMTINGKKVKTPNYKLIDNKMIYLCPECKKMVDMYNEDKSYYYTECECGCLVANKNYLEEQGD